LILKLEAYGLSKSALNLMYSYLSERKQCVKVGVDFSAWENIYKGVPQGSILGLSGFAFIWLWENQWIKFKLSFSKISTSLFNSVSEYDNVLSSA
jgi:hypothetical protein